MSSYELNKASRASSRYGFVKTGEVVADAKTVGIGKKLKVGDILYTKPHSIEDESLASRLFYKAESIYQGSKYTHTGLYVGDGKIVDAGVWGKGKKRDTKVHLVDLADYKKRYDFKVLRIKASAKEKIEATKWAKGQIGRDFNTSGIVKMVVNPLKRESGKARERKIGRESSFFCSELVASAYAPHVRLAAKKKLKHILPGDIFRSPSTKTVAQFEKKAQVSAYQQKTEWSCSAATLKAVALHHGVDLSEEEII